MGLRLINSVDPKDKVWGTKEYMKAIETGKKFRAGAKLFDELSAGDRQFDVVIAPRNYNNGAAIYDGLQGANAEEIWGHMKGSTNLEGIVTPEGKRSRIPQLAHPVVFWNPTMTLAIIGDQKGLQANSLDVEKVNPPARGKGLYSRTRAGMKGKPNIVKRVVVYTKTDLPPWLVLFHELGHIRQSFENGGGERWLRYTENLEVMEKDNADRVEHPLCDQARLPKRATYLHLEMSIPMTGNFKSQVIDGSKPESKLLYVANNKTERENIDRELAEEASANADKDPNTVVGLFYNIH